MGKLKAWCVPAFRRSGVKAWSQIFLGLLAYLVCSAALANDIQMPHLQQAHTLKIVKGPSATPNNALLSPYRVLNSTDVRLENGHWRAFDLLWRIAGAFTRRCAQA